MANTYSQLHVHFVWAVKFRAAQLDPKWRDDLFKFMTNTVKNRGQKMLQVNGMADHVHMLVGMTPDLSSSELMKDTKGASSKWINDNKLTKSKFRWQEGFGCFCVCRSKYPNVIKYIQNQEQHHQKKTFLKEYVELLELEEIDFDPRYIFKEMA